MGESPSIAMHIPEMSSVKTRCDPDRTVMASDATSFLPDHEPGILSFVRFLHRLDDQSSYLLFHEPPGNHQLGRLKLAAALSQLKQNIVITHKNDRNLVGFAHFHNITLEALEKDFPSFKATDLSPDTPICEISLVIAQEFQGYGLGRRLFTNSLLEAKRKGFDKTIWVVRESNIRMQALIETRTTKRCTHAQQCVYVLDTLV